MLMIGLLEELIMRGTLLAVLSAAALTGCFTTAEVGYRGTYTSTAPGDGYATSPDLVTVSPGVQVVADYDEPVFYTDGFYWRFNDGYWYRSNSYYTGFYFYERPPVAVLRIDRPYAYAHYRPQGYVVRNNRARYRAPETITRDHRQPAYRAEPVVRPAPATSAPYRNDTVVRDHRAPQAPAAAPVTRAAPAPAPVVRDHRKAPPPAKEVVRDHR
jgi:hypothetical protein